MLLEDRYDKRSFENVFGVSSRKENELECTLRGRPTLAVAFSPKRPSNPRPISLTRLLVLAYHETKKNGTR